MNKIVDSFHKAEFSVIWWDKGESNVIGRSRYTVSTTWGDGTRIIDTSDWDEAHFEFTTTVHQIIIEVDILRPSQVKDWTPES